jgi:hypothetical protein
VNWKHITHWAWLCLLVPGPLAYAEDPESVEPTELERPIDGVGSVEREPLERDLDDAGGAGANREGAGLNRFIRALGRMVRPDNGRNNNNLIPAFDPQIQRFMPDLNRLLTIEIHYLRKICNPGPQELEQIRAAGKAELIELAKVIAKNEHSAFRNEEKDARERLLDVLLDSAREVLPSDQFERYQSEVQKRLAFRSEGASELITLHVDHSLAFTSEEYDRVAAHLVENAKPQWAHNLQTYMYRDYCPLPDSSLLAPVLNERQKKVWNIQGRTHSMIHFGWPQSIGLDWLGGGHRLEELDDYSNETDDE